MKNCCFFFNFIKHQQLFDSAQCDYRKLTQIRHIHMFSFRIFYSFFPVFVVLCFLSFWFCFCFEFTSCWLRFSNVKSNNNRIVFLEHRPAIKVQNYNSKQRISLMTVTVALANSVYIGRSLPIPH